MSPESSAGQDATLETSLRTESPPRARPGGLGWLLFNIVQAIFTGFWCAFWISSAIVVRAFTITTYFALGMARRCWAPGLLWGSGARMDIRGLDRFDKTKPHVFVSNHQSMIDIAVVFYSIPQNVRFVLKQELKYVPFIGWYGLAMGMFFVDRKNRPQAITSLRRAANAIRKGASVIAFAEGTRSRTGKILPFKKGPFVLAIEAGVEVIPMAISGAVDVLPADGFRVRPGTIRVAFGDPIVTEGLSVEERAQVAGRAEQAVAALYAELEKERATS
ncbi:MAG: lysophospholipid acyltransferase family protein [Myxococcota bacterium]